MNCEVADLDGPMPDVACDDFGTEQEIDFVCGDVKFTDACGRVSAIDCGNCDEDPDYRCSRGTNTCVDVCRPEEFPPYCVDDTIINTTNSDCTETTTMCPPGTECDDLPPPGAAPEADDVAQCFIPICEPEADCFDDFTVWRLYANCAERTRSAATSVRGSSSHDTQ